MLRARHLEQVVRPWTAAARELGGLRDAATPIDAVGGAANVGALAPAVPVFGRRFGTRDSSDGSNRNQISAGSSTGAPPENQLAPLSGASPASSPEVPGTQTSGLARAAAAFNTLTGYDAVEGLKHEVAAADAQLRSHRARLGAARTAYEAALAEQRALSREMGVLLQRKSSWGPDDVARFTEVYAREHAMEGAVADAKSGYEAAGVAVETAQEELMVRIRERYTQEQLYSDKIRSAATWWTWGLMGLQAASFVTVYAFMEPRRRALLASSVGEVVEAQAQELRGQIEGLRGEVAALSLGGSSSSSSSSSSSEDGSKGVSSRDSKSASSSAAATKAAPMDVAGAASTAAEDSITAPKKRQPQQQQRPQSSPERWARRSAAAVAREWSKAVNATLHRCPKEVTLSREQAAGLAVASAAAGGALALLAVAALSLAAGGRGGGGGGGGVGASSSAGSLTWGTGGG